MSTISKNKSSFIKINNNPFNKILFEQFLKKEKSKKSNNNRQKNILQNSVNNYSKEKLISKNLNNSANYIKNNTTYNKKEKFIFKASLNLNKFYNNNSNNNYSRYKFFKNSTINKNSNNSFENCKEKNFDIFHPRLKSMINNSKNKEFSLNLSQRINKNSLSPFINKKGDLSKEKNKFKKIGISVDSSRSKTPIITKNIENKSKTVNRRYDKAKSKRNLSHVNKHSYNLLYLGNSLNLNNFIKKKNSENKNLRNITFQGNNIFSKFKPKKKNQNLINKETFQLKHSLLNPLLAKEIFKKENQDINGSNNEANMNYFIEIKPKIIQQESENKLKTDKSGGEILPLTSNSTNMNMLLNNNSTNNNLKQNSNSDINNSNLVIIKQQFNINSNNNLNHNNDSNAQLQNLNIYSTNSLNNTKNNLKENNSKNLFNNDTFNIIKKIPNPSPSFQGKKIKCIHEISKTGLAGEEKKVNQDRDFIFHNFVSGFDNIFMGVCDGHGYYGHEVSEYIKENLPMDLNCKIRAKKLDLNKDNLSNIITDTFIMENKALKNNKQIDSDLSGTTCVSVIYTPQKLIIINLGDSRCVLGSKVNEEWKYENLSRDHKPDVKEEAERILKAGGRIRPMIDEDGNFVGPNRVYMKDKDLPGLAMTRSFGDGFASIAGTISIPEIKEHILKPEDKFLILASDGLFEFISSEEVGNYVKSYYEKNDIVGCCEFLYKESYRKWILEEEDTVDDITIILVFFEED